VQGRFGAAVNDVQGRFGAAALAVNNVQVRSGAAALAVKDVQGLWDAHTLISLVDDDSFVVLVRLA